MGKDIRGAKPWDLVRAGFVVVPQERYLFREMTVAENIGIVPKRKEDPNRRYFSPDDLYALFPRLGERKSQAAGTLSGGERSMLAIARGLALHPTLLVLDEPSLGLAPVMVELIMDKIREISATGLSILLVEQNVHQALALSSWVQVLDAGVTVASDTSANIAQSPILESGFLGVAPGEEAGPS
jgi:branched-chain amino acid transport system ATP-binding protein